MRPETKDHLDNPRLELAELERALHRLRCALNAADDALDHVLNRRVESVGLELSVWLGQPEGGAAGSSD